MNVYAPSAPMTPEALEAALRAIGPVRYHDLHPFHGLLHDGKLNKGQVQAWALNCLDGRTGDRSAQRRESRSKGDRFRRSAGRRVCKLKSG